MSKCCRHKIGANGLRLGAGGDFTTKLSCGAVCSNLRKSVKRRTSAPACAKPLLPAGVLVHRVCKPFSLLCFCVIVVSVCAVAYFLFSEGEEIFFNYSLHYWFLFVFVNHKRFQFFQGGAGTRCRQVLACESVCATWQCVTAVWVHYCLFFLKFSACSNISTYTSSLSTGG
jgi:hypothetical protein